MPGNHAPFQVFQASSSTCCKLVTLYPGSITEARKYLHLECTATIIIQRQNKKKKERFRFAVQTLKHTTHTQIQQLQLQQAPDKPHYNNKITELLRTPVDNFLPTFLLHTPYFIILFFPGRSLYSDLPRSKKHSLV